MNHHLKVSNKEFSDLKGKKRHIITKPGDYRQGDSLTVTQEGTREQMSFAIIAIEDYFKRAIVLTLFAPCITENDLPETVG